MHRRTRASPEFESLVVREVTFQLLQISNASAMIHVDFPTTRRIYTQRMMAMKDAASTGKVADELSTTVPVNGAHS